MRSNAPPNQVSKSYQQGMSHQFRNSFNVYMMIFDKPPWMHLPYFNPALDDYQMYELCHIHYHYTALKPTSLDKWLSCQRWTMRQMWERLTDVMYRLPWQLHSVCLLYNCSDLHLIGWGNIRRDVCSFNIVLSTADIIQHQKKISTI